MRSVMRLASVTPVTYAAILVGLVMVIGSGVIASLSHVGPGMWRRNLQATTGWFLAAFLLQHVFSGLLIGAPPSAAGPAITSASMNLLATTRGIAQLPFLLLGVAAFLFHVGVYARLVAVAFLAERSVRRWSYAGAVAGGVLMIAVGLSLCGIHL
jgi:succinate dehydrogenase/fumarate reductase cytochrome b subunit